MCEVRITKLRTGYRVRKKSPQTRRYSLLAVYAVVLGREKSVEKKKALAL